MEVSRKPLRVLLVEDSHDDADLILHELNEGGFEIHSARVDAEVEMRAALADCSWDVVISDFNLPRFSAHKALAVLREANADCPFIIVSGCIGEESAIALMKEGASDFVMKDGLTRLIPAIERELREATMRREHRHTQEALRANEKLLNGITSALGEGIYVMNVEGELVFMNPEAERLLGWSKEELLGRNIQQIIHSHKADGSLFPEAECGMFWVLQNGGVHRTEEDVFWRKDGSMMPVSITSSAIMENGETVAGVAVFQDIGQRKQAEWDLLESRKQLRELATYLQTVREEERTRIARELHDEFGQMLTGIKYDARWLASSLASEQPEVVSKIASMSKLIDETLDAMRRVAADLRPMMLDDLGLVAALEWLTDEFGKRTGIGIQLEVEKTLRDVLLNDLDPKLATAAFRIVQESLTNVARHAQAEHVRVSLACRDDKLMLQITDDGQGMSSVRKRDSYGIIGMQERVASLGGTLDFSSVAGKGTRVDVALPAKLVGGAGAIQ